MAKHLAILAVALLLTAGLVVGDQPSGTTSSPASPNTTTTTTTTTPTTTTTTTIPTTTTTTTTPTTTKTTTTPTTTKTTTTPTTTKTTTTPTTTNTTTTPTNTTTHTTKTTTPTNTTTHTTKTTTPTTTANATNTTTATTTVIPKTTPIPEEKYDYNVTEKGVTCIIFQGSINFTIVYEANSTKGKTSNKTATLMSPSHPQEGTATKGTCGPSQAITLEWLEDKGAEMNNITLKFSKSKDNQTWSLDSVEAYIFMDPKTFEGAVDINETLKIDAYFTLDPAAIAVNKSYSCSSAVMTTNVTATTSGSAYDLNVTSSMDTVQIQAYNLDTKEKPFSAAITCNGPVKNNNIIPIVVGCALGGLVVIVLIAYLVSRRKQAAAGADYESTA